MPISIDQFRALLQRPDWTRVQESELEATYRRPRGSDDDIPCRVGFVWLTSTLDDITIRYCVGFRYDIYAPDNQDAFDSDPEWIISAPVIDADGALVHPRKLIALLPEAFRAVDLGRVVAPKPVTRVDGDATDVPSDDPCLIAYTIRRDGDSDLQFDGELLYSVHGDDDDDAVSKPSRRSSSALVLALYRTRGGRYVCVHSARAGAQTFQRATWGVSEAEIIAFFGHGLLAKALYRKTGIVDPGC